MSDDREYRLIFALLRELPDDRQWTAQQRQKWLTAIEKAVDLLIEVKEEAEEAQSPYPVRGKL